MQQIALGLAQAPMHTVASTERFNSRRIVATPAWPTSQYTLAQTRSAVIAPAPLMIQSSWHSCQVLGHRYFTHAGREGAGVPARLGSAAPTILFNRHK
jgi:hypothetical protein